jgi:hypothetical protein
MTEIKQASTGGVMVFSGVNTSKKKIPFQGKMKAAMIWEILEIGTLSSDSIEGKYVS